MSRNVEIKAFVSNLARLQETVARISSSGPVLIEQEDTFFHCEKGRLKLRQFANEKGELIFYQRADKARPKESFYLKSETTEPDTMKRSLALAYGILGHVKKRRLLYLLGRTRIHLDEVEDLGEFMELEVVLADDDSIEGGVAEAHELMRLLGVMPDQLIDKAYIDLLRAKD